MSGTSANCPTFNVVVTKTNTGKSSVAALAAAHASSLPTRPVANVGAAQNVASAGGTVTLNGTTMSRELGRTLSVDEVKPAAIAALGEVFGLAFETLPADDGAALWPQPVHEKLAAR